MRHVLISLAISGLVSSAQADDWISVAHDTLRSVEIDLSSIMSSERDSKVAWGRIVLSDSQAARAGYKSVRALNRYDCANRSFVIVKRVYLGEDGHTLREENIDAGKATPVRPGTVDERFFKAVCPAPKKPNLTALAREAERRAAQARATPDKQIRSALQSRQTDVRLVTERHDAAPPKEEHPASTTAHSPAPTPAAEPVRRARAPARLPARPPKTEPEPSPKRLDPHPHWSYSGSTGPAYWAELSPEYRTCRTGQRQSPIDIRNGIKVDQEALQIHYKPSFFQILDNGHTIQVKYGAGSTLTVMGRTYELVQFHFHHPSEERVNGKSFDLDAHLVHRDSEGRLAVLAVLFNVGKESQVIQTLWNDLPLEENIEYQPQSSIQIADLLPSNLKYFSYMGSLTRPPCTEGVLWIVLMQPVELSAYQLSVFTHFYPNNARPVQNTAGRTIKESR